MYKILLIFITILSLNAWAENTNNEITHKSDKDANDGNIFKDIGQVFGNINKAGSNFIDDLGKTFQSDSSSMNVSINTTISNDNNELLAKLKVLDPLELENDYVKYMDNLRQTYQSDSSSKHKHVLETKLSSDGKVMITVAYNLQSKLFEYRIWQITKQQNNKNIAFGDKIKYDIRMLTAMTLPKMAYSINDGYLKEDLIFNHWKGNYQWLKENKKSNRLKPRHLGVDQIALSDDGKLMAFAFRNAARDLVNVVIYETHTGKVKNNFNISVGRYAQYFAYDLVIMCGISFVPKTLDLAICYKDLSYSNNIAEKNLRYPYEPYKISRFDITNAKILKESKHLDSSTLYLNENQKFDLIAAQTMIGPMKFSDDGQFFTINSQLLCHYKFTGKGSDKSQYKFTNYPCNNKKTPLQNSKVGRNLGDRVSIFDSQNLTLIHESSSLNNTDSMNYVSNRGKYYNLSIHNNIKIKSTIKDVEKFASKLFSYQKKNGENLDFEFLPNGKALMLNEKGFAVININSKFKRGAVKNILTLKDPWNRKSVPRLSFPASLKPHELGTRDYYVSSLQNKKFIWFYDSSKNQLFRLSIEDNNIQNDLMYNVTRLIDFKVINHNELLFIKPDEVYTRYYPNEPEQQKALSNLAKGIELMQNGFEAEGIDLFVETATSHYGIFRGNAHIGHSGYMIGPILGGKALFKEYYKEPKLSDKILVDLNAKYNLSQIKKHSYAPITETPEEKTDRLFNLSQTYTRYIVLASRLEHYGVVEDGLRAFMPVLDNPDNTEFKNRALVELLQANLVAEYDLNKAYSMLLKSETDLSTNNLRAIGALNGLANLKKDPKKFCYLLKLEKYCKFYTKSYPIDDYDYLDLEGRSVKSASLPKKIQNITPKMEVDEEQNKPVNPADNSPGAVVLD